MRWAYPAAAAALAITAACGSAGGGNELISEQTPTTITYPPFNQIDPHTSLYFVTLEDTGLAQSQGPERLYNLGINVCQRLDAGQTIDEQITDDAGLGDQMASIVGAAVTDLCPQHSAAVEEYLTSHGG